MGDEPRQFFAAGERGAKRRRSLAWFLAATTILCAASLGVSLMLPRTVNLSPQGLVPAEGGSAAGGYDIHRHAFIKRYGWPRVYLEQHYSHWFRYYPAGTRSVTDADKRAWFAAQPAYRRNKKIPRQVDATLGDGWVPVGSAVEALAFNGAGYWVGWAAILGTVCGFRAIARIARERRREQAECCTCCGYDLRASRRFGRCPECGTPC